MVKVNQNQVIKIVLNKQAVNRLLVNQFEAYSFFDLPLLLKEFLNAFPEFKPLFNTFESIETFNNVKNKVECLYPEFNDLTTCKNKIPFFLLIAHYLVISGFAKSIGITQNNGLIASSSVGDVSVSYQASPYSTKGDEFSYFMASTPYGIEYLAWVSRKSGLLLVN